MIGSNLRHSAEIAGDKFPLSNRVRREIRMRRNVCIISILIATLNLHESANAHTSSVSSPPWNVDTADIAKDSSLYMDLPPTVFAPNGRLFSVEAAVRACDDDSDESSNTAIAIRCKEGVVIVTTSYRSPYLFDPCDSSIENLSSNEDSDGIADQFDQKQASLLVNDYGFDDVDQMDHITKHLALRAPFAGLALPVGSLDETIIFGVTGGNAVDSQIARSKLQRIGDYARASEGGNYFTVGTAARRFADQQHVLTQQGGKGRLLASKVILASACEIWRVDPTGQFWQCQAAAIGKKSSNVEELLLEQLLSLRKKQNTTKKSLWSSLLKPAAKHMRPGVLNFHKPPAIHQLLAELSIEEALALSTHCIMKASIASNAQKQMSKENPAVWLKGLSIRTNVANEKTSQIEYYEHRTLKSLANSIS